MRRSERPTPLRPTTTTKEQTVGFPAPRTLRPCPGRGPRQLSGPRSRTVAPLPVRLAPGTSVFLRLVRSDIGPATWVPVRTRRQGVVVTLLVRHPRETPSSQTCSQGAQSRRQVGLPGRLRISITPTVRDESRADTNSDWFQRLAVSTSRQVGTRVQKYLRLVVFFY